MAEKVSLPVKPYFITDEERAARFTKQQGKCAICVVRTATDLDHNHASGEVRAILCHGCNVMLGRNGENVSILRERAKHDPLRKMRYLRAANYLLAFGRDYRLTAA